MIIIVEHENAISSNIGINANLNNKGQVILNLLFEKQQGENWCWAALAKIIYHFYFGKNIDQKNVAAKLFNVSIKNLYAIKKIKKKYDKNMVLHEALEAVSCFSHWSLGKPTLERIQFEINNGKPICCRVEWYKGNAHYVIVHGYNIYSKELYIMDSQVGESKISYDDFPKNYRENGGAWTETFWTCKKRN